MMLRQLSAKPSEDPQAPFPFVPPLGRRRTRAQRRRARRPLQPFAFVAGQGCGHLIYDLGIPRDIC
jgi:hypothetical protein